MRARLGEKLVRAAIARIDDAHRGAFDPSADAFGVLASTWYPAPAVHALCDALTEGIGATGTRPYGPNTATPHFASGANVTLVAPRSRESNASVPLALTSPASLVRPVASASFRSW